MDQNINIKTLNRIAQAIYDKKGLNILALDVHKLSSLSHYALIAEGNINRHVQALGRHVQEILRLEGETAFYTEGEASGDWIVLDYGDIMIHLLVPDFRERYALEELWRKADIVDLSIDTSQKAADSWE
jgi:ribosome-associated protein